MYVTCESCKYLAHVWPSFTRDTYYLCSIYILNAFVCLYDVRTPLLINVHSHVEYGSCSVYIQIVETYVEVRKDFKDSQRVTSVRRSLESCLRGLRQSVELFRRRNVL